MSITGKRLIERLDNSTNTWYRINLSDASIGEVLRFDGKDNMVFRVDSTPRLVTNEHGEEVMGITATEI